MKSAVEIRVAEAYERNVRLVISVSAHPVDVSIEALLSALAPKILAERLRRFPKHSADFLCARFRNTGGDSVLLRFDPLETDSARVEIRFEPVATSRNPARDTFTATTDRAALNRFIHDLQLMHTSGDCARLELAV